MPPRRPAVRPGPPPVPGGGFPPLAPLLAPPTLQAFPAGYGPVPADWIPWLTNPVTYLARRVVFRGIQTVAQPLTSGINPGTVLSLDTILEDPYSGWQVAGQPANSWTPPFTGLYEVSVNLIVQSGALAAAGAGVQVGVGSPGLQFSLGLENVGGLVLGGSSGSIQRPMTAGLDFVQAFGIVTAATNTLGGVAGRWSSMEIVWLSS